METYRLGHRLAMDQLAAHLVDRVEKETLSVEELKIDWQAWAKIAQKMMKDRPVGGREDGCIAPGVRLIRKTDDAYGDEEGLAIRLEEPDKRCYRIAAREWKSSELKPGIDQPVGWWIKELQTLFADALIAHRILLPEAGREWKRIIRRLRILDQDEGSIYGEEIVNYVPDDQFSRAYLASIEQTGDRP